MTFTTYAPSAGRDTAASRQAQANLRANLGALDATQPRLINAMETIDDVEFVYARDGALTARIANGWWSRCSVPRLAAVAMLKKLELRGAVACFLSPTHAGQLRAALDVLRPEQAIVAVVPEPRDLCLMLHCDDFSQQIAAHRLWFVNGQAWEDALLALFDEQIGLATPAQFIRVAVSGEDVVARMIDRAQRVFSDVVAKRSTAMQQIRATAPRVANRSGPLCVVAPSQFRLWNDVGGAMLSAMAQTKTWVRFDADDPACSSPLALAEIVRGSAAVLTANTSRGDLPGIVPDATPWITWVTTPRIPSFGAAGAKDQLLLADASSVEHARKNGWPANRVHLATWPAILPSPCCSGQRAIGIVVDTHSLDQPKELAEYSSHGLLWDFIRDDLSRDPFALQDDVSKYLQQCMRRFEIADDGFPRALFIDRLIVPAYQQSIARALLAFSVPLHLYGRGWSELDEFRAHFAGVIDSRGALQRALQSVAALVNVWPVNWIHPSEFAGVTTVARQSRRDALLKLTQLALAGKSEPRREIGPPLSALLISRILERC